MSNITTYSPNNSKYSNRLFTLKSDHAMSLAIYSCKNIDNPPLFHKFRDQKHLTKYKLTNRYKEKYNIKSVLNFQDPNKVENILVDELNL